MNDIVLQNIISMTNLYGGRQGQHKYLDETQK